MLRFRRRRFYYYNCYNTQKEAIGTAQEMKVAKGCFYQVVPMYGMWEVWLSKIVR